MVLYACRLVPDAVRMADTKVKSKGPFMQTPQRFEATPRRVILSKNQKDCRMADMKVKGKGTFTQTPQRFQPTPLRVKLSESRKDCHMNGTVDVGLPIVHSLEFQSCFTSAASAI